MAENTPFAEQDTLRAIADFGDVASFERFALYMKVIMPRLRRIFAAGGKAIPGLLAALEDENPRVRQLAAGAIGLAGDHTVRGQLEAKRGQETDPSVQSALNTAISRLGDDSSILAAVEQLKSESEVQRRAALRLLAGQAVGVPYVFRVGMEDASVRVRRDVVARLGTLYANDPILLEAMLVGGLMDAAPLVRVGVIHALKVSQLPDSRVRYALLRALKDTEPEIRRSAIYALNTPDALPALLDTLAAETDRAATDLSLSVIHNIVVENKHPLDDPTPVIDVILHYETRMANPGRHLWLAAEILGEAPTAETIHALIRIIDYDPQLDLTDANSLSVRGLRAMLQLRERIGYAAVSVVLTPYLSHMTPRTRISAITAFGVLGGDEAYIQLRMRVDMEDHPHVRGILNAMTRIVAPPNPIDPAAVGKVQSVASLVIGLSEAVEHAEEADHIPLSVVNRASQPYTLQLVELICDQNQESDGDEIYLKLGEQIVWATQALKRTMVANITRSEQINHYHFERVQVQGEDGWQADSTYRAEQFRFSALSRPTALQVWEADGVFRGGDDFIGQVVVTPNDAALDFVRVQVAGMGARYTVVYRVMVS
ncbi:MAG: HEAT repeat domain-containing protein [Phototrophicaceae bacterium]